MVTETECVVVPSLPSFSLVSFFVAAEEQRGRRHNRVCEAVLIEEDVALPLSMVVWYGSTYGMVVPPYQGGGTIPYFIIRQLPRLPESCYYHSAACSAPNSVQGMSGFSTFIVRTHSQSAVV